MATKSQATQLAERLRDVRARSADLRKQLEGLEQQERRLAVALEVLTEEFGGGVPQDSEPRQAVTSEASGRRKGGSVEQMILDHVFTQRDGLTSAEVVELLAPHITASYGTVITSLSRMVGKGLLRRQGKLAFLTPKGRKP